MEEPGEIGKERGNVIKKKDLHNKESQQKVRGASLGTWAVSHEDGVTGDSGRTAASSMGV